jgi:chromosome segregation ATPase
MSIAGKVLIVLIMLASLVWIILTAGVAQLNRNGNKVLIELTEKVAKLRDDLKTTQGEIAKLKGEAGLLQEKMDRDLAVIRVRQADVEKANSAIREIFSSVEYERANLEEIVNNARQQADQRLVEENAERKALAEAKADVETLKAQDRDLRNRLETLRTEFKTILKANIEMLGQVRK